MGLQESNHEMGDLPQEIEFEEDQLVIDILAGPMWILNNGDVILPRELVEEEFWEGFEEDRYIIEGFLEAERVREASRREREELLVEARALGENLEIEIEIEVGNNFELELEIGDLGDLDLEIDVEGWGPGPLPELSPMFSSDEEDGDQ